MNISREAINSNTLFPDTCITQTPDLFDLPYKEIRATSSNGARVHGWIIPAPSARAVVMISHGNAGNVGTILPWPVVLYHAGITTVVYDYQGYGDSEGSADMGTLVDDARAVWNALDAELPDDPAWPVHDAKSVCTPDMVHHRERSRSTVKRLYRQARLPRILMGLSLGTMVSCALAAEVGGLLAGLVLEGSLIPRIELKRMFGVLGAPMAALIESQVPEDLHSDDSITQVQCPIVFLHGTDDDITSLSGARQLYDLAPEPKHFVEMPHTGHLDAIFLWSQYPDMLLEQLNAMIDAVDTDTQAGQEC